MSRSTKAALLSALVFPGLGHFYLKRHVTGAILVTVALAALYLLISSAADTAMQITEQIQHGNVPLDVSALTKLIEQQPTGGEAQFMNAASTALLVSWLIGIVDSFRVGHAMDKGNAA
ncbi:MAG: hypothetical protein WBM71_15640 [Sedimenticolaceae bacterium]